MNIADTCNEGNKVGEVRLDKDENNNLFIDGLVALSENLLDLQSDSEDISNYIGWRFAYANEIYGDPGSLYRDWMQESQEKNSEDDAKKISFLYTLTVACLESMEAQNPNGRSVVARKQIVDKDYKTENPLIFVTGYKSEQPVFQVQGITKVMSDATSARNKSLEDHFGCPVETTESGLYLIPSLE
jgi:hypothetical protein